MNDALDLARTKTFSEEYHCALFAADVVLSMTDVDPMTTDERQAGSVALCYALMRAEYATLQEALAGRIGARIPVSFARRGDVMLRMDGADNAIGICVGELSAFISSEGGLAFFPTLEMAAAFAVGR